MGLIATEEIMMVGDTLSDLYRQSHAALRALGLPRAGFDLPVLHAALESRRGRLIHLIPRHLPAMAPHGVWVAGQMADYVFYDVSGGPVRAHQIIGHEYGHLIFDDVATSAGVDELRSMFISTVSPDSVTRLLTRTSYAPVRERRAEVFGSVVVQRIEAWSALPCPRQADPDLLARISATLEGVV